MLFVVPISVSYTSKLVSGYNNNNNNNVSISIAQNKLSSVALTAVQTNMSFFVSWQTVPHKRTRDSEVVCTVKFWFLEQ